MKKIIPLLFAAASAHAQSVLSVEFTGQPTINTDKGVVTGCDIRFLAVTPSNPGFQIIDGSVVAFTHINVGVKAGMSTGARGPGGDLRTTASNKKPAWLRVEGASPMAPGPKGVFASEDKGFYLYVAEFKDGLESLWAMQDGSPLWVAFESAPGKTIVYSGPVVMSEQDKTRFRSCMDEFAKQLERGPK